MLAKAFLVVRRKKTLRQEKNIDVTEKHCFVFALLATAARERVKEKSIITLVTRQNQKLTPFTPKN